MLETGAGKHRAAKLGIREIGMVKDRVLKYGVLQVRSIEASMNQICARQIGGL